MTHKLARLALTRTQLDKLAPGKAVINANMDIFVKRRDGRWEGEDIAPVTTTLLKRSPIKLWPYPVTKQVSA